MGDLCKKDKEGNFWFMSRADDLLKVGSAWIAPTEIENCIKTHPDVVDCGVVGVKDREIFMQYQNIERAKNELESVLGREKVLTEDFILSSYIRDGSNLIYPLSRPSLVTLPHATEEVQEIIQIGNAYKIPVVPSGGRTTCWGAIESNRGIVIDMCNMNSMIEIDEQNLTFTAEAGANIDHINKELKKRGVCYPNHPLHTGPKSLGAEVAKNTCGGAQGMYGHAAKRVIGLEVVLGNGDILVTGSSRVIKNAPHFLQPGIPDLTQLFVASEGAFGVITEVTMRMSKRPLATGYVDIKFEGSMDGFQNLLGAFHDIKMRKMACAVASSDPYAMWLLARGSADDTTSKNIEVESIEKQYGHVLYVTVESFVSQEECNFKEKTVLEICEKYGGESLGDTFSKDRSPEKGGELFIRYILSDGSPYFYIVAEPPVHSVPKLYKRWLELVDLFNWPRKKAVFLVAFDDESCQVMCFSFPNPYDEKVLQKCRALNEKMMEFYAEVGSIPYRIGRIWRPYILDKLDSTYLKYIRNIKRQFDPNNIMNPGVSVFEEE